MSSSRKCFLYMLGGKLGDVIETNEELADLDDGHSGVAKHSNRSSRSCYVNLQLS